MTLYRHQIEFENPLRKGCKIADTGFVPFGSCKMAEGF